MLELGGERRDEHGDELREPLGAHLGELGAPETRRNPRQTIEAVAQHDILAREETVERETQRIELALLGGERIGEHGAVGGDARLGHPAAHAVHLMQVAAQLRALVLAHALACERDAHVRAHIVGDEHEREELACDRLLGEAVVLVDAAEPVIHEKHAGTVVALAQVGRASELGGDRHAELLLPSLGAKLREVRLPQLHREVAAAVAASMAAVALRGHGKHEDG